MSGDGYGYLFLGCCDAQFAFFRGDVVVICIKLLTCCIGNGIGYFTFTYIGNTSGCTDIGYLSCYKSVSSCYIRSGQGRSVIRFVCTFAGKGYLSWADLKFSVSYYKNDTRKVPVLVGELCFFQTHRIGAGICSLCFCLSTEFKVIFCIQIRIIFTDFYAFHLISAYTVFGSVIRFSICISLNGYNDCLFTFFNSQFSDCNLDIIVGSFGILIQLVGKSIIAASLIGLGSGYIVGYAFTGCKAVTAYGYVVVGQRGSVVDLFISCAGKYYLSWGNGKGSVRYYEFHVCKVRVRIFKLSCCQAHRVCSFCCICFFHFCSSTEAEICLFVQTTVTGNDCLIAFRFLRSSVILLRICMSGDGYGYLFLGCCDAQFAFFRGDVVVICIKLLTCCIGNGIGYFTFTYIGNTSGCTDIGYLSCYKSVSSCHTRSGQRRSVIRLACTFTGKVYLSWGDGKASVLGLYLELAGYHVSFFIRYHRGSGDVVGVASCVLLFRVLRTQSADCVAVPFHCELIGLHSNGFMLFSVIGCSCAVRLYRYLILRLAVCDGQRSFLLADLIVVYVGVAVQFIAECICAASHYGLASGKVVGCTFSFCKPALYLKGRVPVHKGVPVILLAQGCTL